MADTITTVDINGRSIVNLTALQWSLVQDAVKRHAATLTDPDDTLERDLLLHAAERFDRAYLAHVKEVSIADLAG